MSKPTAGSLRRIINAAGYSLKGIRAAYRTEAAFRQELILVGVALVVASLIAQTLLQWLLLVVSGLLVLLVELLNSAIEATVDRQGDEWHELSGRAKDMGSAAVFISLLIMALTWGVVLWERGAHWLSGA